MKNFLLVIDLDNTLCNDQHRAHLARDGSWDEYHEQCVNDDVHPEIAALIEILSSATPSRNGDYSVGVIVITGRNEKYRTHTICWLDKHNISHHIDHIFMRPDNDFSPGGPLKVKHLEGYIAANYKDERPMVVCLEDTEKVIDAFRGAGYHCWQVRS